MNPNINYKFKWQYFIYSPSTQKYVRNNWHIKRFNVAGCNRWGEFREKEMNRIYSRVTPVTHRVTPLDYNVFSRLICTRKRNQPAKVSPFRGGRDSPFSVMNHGWYNHQCCTVSQKTSWRRVCVHDIIQSCVKLSHRSLRPHTAIVILTAMSDLTLKDGDVSAGSTFRRQWSWESLSGD